MQISLMILASLGTLSLTAPALAGEPHLTPAPAHHAHAEADPSDKRSPTASYSQIVAGNRRFASGEATHPNQDAGARGRLASDQKPHTIVLSCSDSRVPPELVFDQGLGDIFTVRVAGNIIDAATVASIEYAVAHLGARLIVVLGHESCGAVKAALSTPLGQSAGSRDLDTLVAAIRPNLSPSSADLRAPAAAGLLRAPVKANVNAVAQDLGIRSKIVREAVTEGRLAIVPAIYGLESGLVEFWDDDALK